MNPSADITSFGTLPSGESVDVFTLASPTGASVNILNYGGIVTSLRVPDRSGRLDDVVLGFPDLTGYTTRHPYFGAITGRVAGRIAHGKLSIDGQTWQLPLNSPPHHLHGGFTGLDQRLWTASPFLQPDGNEALRLTYRSPDGEEGYPGTVDFAVTYTFTADHQLVIETEAVSDQPTPVNLTHHSYFHLAGEGSGSIDEHSLEIFAAEFVPTDDEMTLTARRVGVTETNDFRQPRRLGDALPKLFQSHGDLYFLDRTDADSLVLAARVSEPTTGRTMEVRTTDSCLQFYSAAALDGSIIGKSGRPYPRHGALCLECQGYPDVTGDPALGNIVVRPGQNQRHTTIYSFSTL